MERKEDVTPFDTTKALLEQRVTAARLAASQAETQALVAAIAVGVGLGFVVTWVVSFFLAVGAYLYLTKASKQELAKAEAALAEHETSWVPSTYY